MGFNRRQLDSANPVQFPSQIELRRVPASFLTRLRRLRFAARFGFVFHRFQMSFDRFIAFLDALLICLVDPHLLTQDKQQLRPPIDFQTLRNFLFAGLDARIGQFRQLVPIALTL